MRDDYEDRVGLTTAIVCVLCIVLADIRDRLKAFFKHYSIFGIIFFVLGCLGIGMVVGLHSAGKKELAADIAIITVLCWIGFIISVLIWNAWKSVRKIQKDTEELIDKMPKPEP